MSLSLLRRRRGSIAWLLLIVLLAVVLAVLATIPILSAPAGGRIGSLVGERAPGQSGR